MYITLPLDATLTAIVSIEGAVLFELVLAILSWTIVHLTLSNNHALKIGVNKEFELYTIYKPLSYTWNYNLNFQLSRFDLQ